MKSTPTLRFSIQRLFLLSLVSFLAVAALLGIAASASKANRAAKARAELAANTKSAINPGVEIDKQPLAPAAAVIVATLTDNVAAATKVAPGGVINYTATVTNNGAASPADDAINLNFSAPLDANTTLVAGSVHASPIATNDTYNWVGNTQLDTVARALPAVTANDIAVNAPAGTDTFTLTAIAGGATALGGVVTLASPSGSFVYTPPLGRPNIADGATAQDSFTYTITNSADPTLTSTGTVRINLTGRVWYLVAGGLGDGRSNTPSGNPAAMSTAADKSTDFFYIFSNAASLNGPFSVDAGQQLLGQGVNLVVSAITLFNSAAPTPTTTNTAGSCVALAGAPGSNTLSGFNIGNCTGGTAITGANVGTLNVSTMTINTNGGALDLTGVGSPTVSVVLGGTTSTGGAKNVNLVGLNGTFTLASGALSGATGNGFDVSGGTATITYLGTISNSGAKQVNIANKTGGSVTLDGAVSGTGTGINLTNNTGATITFRGGVVISSGANTAFNATGGGTINVCDENPCVPGSTGALVNTLTATTGSGLNVVSTTIGANKLEFRSITSNGSGTANGIVLDNAGAGGLTVAGNGGSCISAATCTGGTISTKTGADGTGNGIGIYVNNTSNVSITRMKLNDFSNYAIRGTTVTNFTLNNSFIDGVNGSNAGADEGTIIFDGLLGTSSFSGDTIKGGIEDNFRVRNSSGTANNITVDSCTIRDTSTGVTGNDNLIIEASGTANVTAHITNNTFAATNGDHIQMNTINSATMSMVITGNFYSGGGGGSALGQGITISGGNAGSTETVRFDISNNGTAGNPLVGNIQGGAINVNEGNGAGNWQGRVSNNFIGNAAVAGSGSAQAGGIRMENHSPSGSLTAIISGNTIRQWTNGPAINSQAGDAGNATHNAIINLTVTNNTAANPVVASAQHGFVANIGASGVATAADVACTDIATNTLDGNAATGGSGVRLRHRGMSTIKIPGYLGAQYDTAAVIAFETGKNPASTPAPTAATSSAGPGYGNTVGSAPCTQPIIPTIPQPIDKTARNRDNASDSYSSANAVAQTKTELAKPLVTTPVARVASKDGMVSVLAKTTPIASAAEVARIYRSERTLSHHAVRSSFKAFSQDPNAPTAGEIVTLNTIATFPAAGKSITIKYSATVNTTVLTARQATTQGTVTANGGINVTTTDPGPPVVAGATVTLLDTTLTWTGATDTDWNTATNWNRPGPVVSSYAPGVSNPAVNDVVIPNVGAQPTISASDIGIYSLNISNGRTLTITNPRVLTIGGSPGGDLTLDGIISGGFLNLGTGTHVITNVGGTGSLSSTNVATVLSGGTVTLNNNLQAGALGVNAGGSMNITNRTLSLNGSGAALVVPGGATFTTTGSTVIFNGTAAQTAAGVAYNNLTINNSIGTNITGVTLTGNATVNGVLALTSSDLATGAFTLTQPNTTASTGVSDVVGTVIRTGGPFGLISLTFGNPNNIITFTGAGTRPTTMTVVLGKAAPATYAAAVQRNYTMSQTGGAGFTATVRLHYLDSELNGNTPETSLGLRRLRTADNHWVAAPPPPGVPTRDGAANWIEAAGVLAADLTTQWTFSILAPTASGGTVTGRIVDQSGNPVEGAVVRLEGTQNRKFITDANGFYRFDNVTTNGFYTVTPSRANYSFTPSVRSFSQLGDSTEAAFGGTLATSNLVNPLDTPEYFVRQHYVDFLGREPDEAGFNFWSDQIIECGADQNCIERRRENVSAAYFLSIEFQKTGGLVDGLYRASYGVAPQYSAFMPDTRTVGLGVQVNKDGWEALLEANTEAFVNAFVNRPEFVAVYGNMDNSLFVDTLISHTGVAFTAAERDALVSGLGTGTMTRAEALRSIAENSRFVNAKFNQAFVMMEYYGYLRRDYDAGGYAFWLNKLNEFNGNFEQAEMVKAFIVSGEYHDRFPK
jgi:hypothetical protein